MRVAVPPAIGSVYRSPRMSKHIVRPSGETSSEIQVASSVVKRSARGVASGSELVRAAARMRLSFWAGVWAARAVAVASSAGTARARAIERRNVMRSPRGKASRWAMLKAPPSPGAARRSS